MTTKWATFGENWATFYSNIWSHCRNFVRNKYLKGFLDYFFSVAKMADTKYNKIAWFTSYAETIFPTSI